MYESLCTHPLVVQAKRRETHFFDWRWCGDEVAQGKRRGLYEKYFYMVSVLVLLAFLASVRD